jgi:hypothetical protein
MKSRGWGLGGEGLPGTAAPQHRSLNLWPSGLDSAGSPKTAVRANRILTADRVLFPADDGARI